MVSSTIVSLGNTLGLDNEVRILSNYLSGLLYKKNSQRFDNGWDVAVTTKKMHLFAVILTVSVLHASNIKWCCKWCAQSGGILPSAQNGVILFFQTGMDAIGDASKQQ